MDLDTFMTILYVVVDDWYNIYIRHQVERRKAGLMKLSDSEVLTIALAGQWKVGVPWHSERSIVRYMQINGRHWFPHMLGRSAFNLRVRQLCSVLAELQRWLADLLPDNHDYEVADGVPLPICSLSQAQRQQQHWLGQFSNRGHGGTQGGWFYGQRWWVSVAANGMIRGWIVAAAHINERWLLEAFLSVRKHDGRLQSPPANTSLPRAERVTPPHSFIGAFFAVGEDSHCPYLVDRGLNGYRWICHWMTQYQADVISIPPDNTLQRQLWSRSDCLWHAHHRQIIETVFATLTTVFGIRHVNAHSLWGQYTRLAAKAAAHNFALWLNHLLGRPLHAVATLLI